MTRADLWQMTRRQLWDVLAAGHPIDPAALDDTEYQGTALGFPPFARALLWTKFFKVFHRDPATGRLRGWNCQAVDSPLDEPWELAMRRGAPVTYWFYEVVEARGHRSPYPHDRGLRIDYGLGRNPLLSPNHFVADPLVAVEPGRVDLLLGVSFLALGPLTVHLPTWFCLERGGPLRHIVPPPRQRQV